MRSEQSVRSDADGGMSALWPREILDSSVVARRSCGRYSVGNRGRRVALTRSPRSAFSCHTFDICSGDHPRSPRQSFVISPVFSGHNNARSVPLATLGTLLRSHMATGTRRWAGLHIPFVNSKDPSIVFSSFHNSARLVTRRNNIHGTRTASL
jgi:hypothetical protein